MPTSESSQVDVEALIETHYGVRVDYGGAVEPGVLGFTVFEAPVQVVISKVLTDAATRDGARQSDIGRWRATIAHEAAHILLHARLFDQAADGRAPHSFARCPAEAIDGSAAVRDWREVQANMGMAAFLMPGSIFDPFAVAFLTGEPDLPIPPIAQADAVADRLVRAVATAFNVSRQAASIRYIARGFVAE